MNRYTITDGNLHIVDSYAVPKGKFARTLASIRALHPDCKVWERGTRGMHLEWAVHNALYAMGLWKERTGSVDLNTNQKWHVKLAYTLAGHIVWPFIK